MNKEVTAVYLLCLDKLYLTKLFSCHPTVLRMVLWKLGSPWQRIVLLYNSRRIVLVHRQ